MARKTKKKVPRGGQELSSCLQGHTTWKADTIQHRRMSDAELELMYESCMEGHPKWTGATLWKTDTNGGSRQLSDEALELMYVQLFRQSVLGQQYVQQKSREDEWEKTQQNRPNDAPTPEAMMKHVETMMKHADDGDHDEAHRSAAEGDYEAHSASEGD